MNYNKCNWKIANEDENGDLSFKIATQSRKNHGEYNNNSCLQGVFIMPHNVIFVSLEASFYGILLTFSPIFAQTTFLSVDRIGLVGLSL